MYSLKKVFDKCVVVVGLANDRDTDMLEVLNKRNRYAAYYDRMVEC